MSNLAAFTIQGTPSSDPTTGDRIYRARSGENLAIALEQNPSPLVNAVTFQLYDPSNSNSPQASFSARAFGSPLVFTENSSRSYSPADKQSTVHVQMPASTSLPGGGAGSWILRSLAITPDGLVVFDRGIALNCFPDSFREPVPAERSEFYGLGWDSQFGSAVANSFPIRSKFKTGVSTTLVTTNVCAITPTKSRRGFANTHVWAKKTAAGDSLWQLSRQFSVDGAGVITLSTNALIIGKSGGTVVADADFVPAIAVVSNQLVVALTQGGAGTYTYDVFFEVMEQPL